MAVASLEEENAVDKVVADIVWDVSGAVVVVGVER